MEKLNKKEALSKIQDRLQKNVSRQEILDELSEQYYEKSTIAQLIASTPDPQIKEQYKNLNNLLLGLLALTVLVKILTGIFLLSSVSVFLTPLAFVLPFMSILFAWEVWQYRGYIYNILGLLAIAGMLQTASKVKEFDAYFIIDVLIALSISGLAFYLGKKMFPHYGFFGPKKDADGNVLFG